MVKPPKKWLQEYANSKSKYENNEEHHHHDGGGHRRKRAKKGGATTDNDFRHYMARKIDLQRQQFGLVLPPPPQQKSSSLNYNEQKNDEQKETIEKNDEQEDTYETETKILLHHEKGVESSILRHSKQPKDRGTNTEEINRDETEEKRSPCCEKGERIKKSVRFDEQNNDYFNIGGGERNEKSMGGVLNRLKQKHGSRRRRKSRKMMSELKKAKGEKEKNVVINSQLHVDDDSQGRKAMHEKDINRSQVIKDKTASLREIIHESNQQVTICQSENQPSYDEDTTFSQSQSPSNVPTPLELKRQRPDLFFLGITVMVNGYTNPCSDTIMRTLHRYGGNLEKYETGSVTHIIAQNLSMAKANIYKRQKKPIPVVKPTWIEDCVEAQKLLPHQHYLLDEVKDDSLGTTTSVASYFHTKVKNDSLTKIMNSYNPPKENNISQSRKSSVSSPIIHSSSLSGPRNVGNDPHFLDSYFASSRLSFIGSFKQRLKNNSNSREKLLHQKGCDTFVFHVDMDCFFAAIAVRNYPQYKNKPVAVGHGWKNDPNGVGTNDKTAFSHQSYSGKKSTSELSTCNYEARKYGIKKGMFEDRARKLCPELVILPYDYDGYEDASTKVAEILNQFADSYNGVVEQVSCDESYLELPLDEHDFDGETMDISALISDIANKVKGLIFDATECTVSIGIGSNKLLAKLATDKVKAGGGNDIHFISDHKAFLADVKLRDLPGVGYRLDRKLQSYNLFNVNDVWEMESDEELCSILGRGNGQKIYRFCQGEDSRPVKSAERKTIGAECNYGVRFHGQYGVEHMMNGLAKEVVKRMTGVGVFGKHITIKVKERQHNAPSPGKFNGHGKCNDYSKSRYLSVHNAKRDVELFCQEGMTLFVEIGVHKDRVRGMGMIISKLESADTHHKSSGQDTMNAWLQQSALNHLSGGDAINNANENYLTTSPCKENDEIFRHRKITNDLSGYDRSCEKDFNQTIDNNEQLRKCSRDELLLIEQNDENQQANTNDIVLPPLQDISMDDVMALPPDLREAILVQMKDTQQYRSRKRISPKQTKKKSPKHGHIRSKTPKCHPKVNGQIDMKRMMRLVSVKRGTDKLEYDGEQVSLTQLDRLPLDVQLQVANDDTISTKSFSVYQSENQRDHPKARRSLYKSPIIIDDKSDDDSRNEYDQAQEMHGDIENDSSATVHYNEKTFNHEDEENDIKALSKWLHEKSKPEDEDINKLEEFLCICISERRVDDVVILLRLVKRKWEINQYETVLGACNEHFMKFQGRNLDLRGLGLLK